MGKENKMNETGCMPKEQGLIIKTLDVQDKEIEQLNGLIDQVYSRFAMALRNEPIEPSDPNGRIESNVPLMANIERKSELISDANTKLEQLIQLCEL